MKLWPFALKFLILCITGRQAVILERLNHSHTSGWGAAQEGGNLVEKLREVEVIICQL